MNFTTFNKQNSPVLRHLLPTFLLIAFFAIPKATAQDAPASVSLDEAVQLALVKNYTIQQSRLDVEMSNAQVGEAWGQVMPTIDASSNFTRNVKSANPFAGSSAGGLFSGLNAIGWLIYNEDQRTDGDPATLPIELGDYFQRQADGMTAAGIESSSGSNPFAVDNQFQNGITVSQTLYSGKAFAAIRAAEKFKDINRFALERQEQILVNTVNQQYYQALLATEQANVLKQSVTRTRQTVEEVKRQLAQGVSSKFERLTAEVELSNLETQHSQAENQVALAINNLKLTLGIEISQTLTLRDRLEIAENNTSFIQTSLDDVLSGALTRRPDLAQATSNIGIQKANLQLTRAEYIPVVSLFANFNYTGSVPDDRTFAIADPNDPFTFTKGESDFFSDSYWNPAINVGLRFQWNIFNGFQTSRRMQQRRIDIKKAEIQRRQLEQGIILEIDAALRNLKNAEMRIASQKNTVSQAELNYEFAVARLREGVSNPFDERQASNLLDQSRLGLLQAIFDFNVAKSSFNLALGTALNSTN